MEPMKILLADDHNLFRSGVASLLGQQEDFEVVGEARNGEEALEKARELMPDVILMDIYMPGCTGLEATRRIKEVLPYAKIIILTVSEEDQTLFEAVKSGAHGYLLKKIEPDQLFSMIRGVFKGEAPISRATAAKILNEFAKQRSDEPREKAHKSLTAREREVLMLLTQGSTNKEIASSLGISENTVKNHLRNILEKLHLENRVQAAAFAIREGLLPPEEPDSH
jgi:RNA polymerase sigma factor (sigma-70 family)